MNKHFLLAMMLSCSVSAFAQYNAPTITPTDILHAKSLTLSCEDGLAEESMKEKDVFPDSIRTLGAKHQAAIARLPKGADLKTNLIIDDGTRLVGGITMWGGGDFTGLSSLRLVDGTYPVSIAKDAACTDASTFDGTYYYSKSYATGGGQVIRCLFNVYDVAAKKSVKALSMEPQYYNVTLLMAYNPKDKNIWGVGCDGLGRPFLVNIDNETGANQYISQTPFTGKLSCMAFSADGTLYGVNTSGELVTVDLQTFQVTKIATIMKEGAASSCCSLAFDYHTGKMYFTVMKGDWSNAIWLVDPKTGSKTKVSDLPNSFRFNGSYVVSPTANAKAPNTVAGLKVDFKAKGSYTGNVCITAPTTCFDGSKLVGTQTMKLYVDSVLVATKSQEPGTTINLSHDFKTRGEHWVQVVYSNANGNSPCGSIKPFCGVDVPDDVHNLKMSIDDQNGTTSLSWDAVDKGIHDGYVDLSDISYSVVRMPDNVVVSSGQKTTTFTEKLANDKAPQRYHYEVWATSGGVDADKVASNSVVYGKPLEVPVKECLGSDYFGQLLTTENLDGHGDGFYNGWGVEFVSGGYCDTSFVNDKWMYTPAIHLEKGRYYYRMQHDGKDYELYYGKYRTPESQKLNKIGVISELAGENDFVTAEDNMMNQGGYTSYITYKKLIDVKETGDYYFGVHYNNAYTGGQTGSFGMLRLWELKQGPAVDAPAACQIDTAYTQPKGELNNNIKFKTPVKNLLGNALKSLSKVEFYLSTESTDESGRRVVTNELVYTMDNVEPGKEYTATVKAHQGNNLYYFYAYDDKGIGDEAEVTIWAGNDYPQTVTNPKYKVVDNKDIIMTWEAPSELGQQGGYVSPSDLTYYPGVTEYPANGLVDLNTGQKETTYTFIGEAGEQYRYYYGVTPANSIGRGQGIATPIVIGTPYKAPFSESFDFSAGAFKSKVWSLMLVAGSHSWSARAMSPDLTFKPYDNDGAMLTFKHDDDVLSAEILGTPLMEITGMKKPTLSFEFYHNANCTDANAGITIYPVVDDVMLKSITSIGLKGDSKTSGWKHYEIPLDSYNGEKRVFFYILGSSKLSSSILALDKLELYDNVPVDLAVESVDAPVKIMPNEQNTIKASVSNYGRNTIEKYTVGLFANGELVATEGGENLAFKRNNELTFNFVPAPKTYGKTVDYTVKVLLEDDANDENDSITTTVNVNNTQLPAPSSLALNGNRLSWVAPAVPEWQSVREDFESYAPFIIDNIGDWTVYDGDKQLSQSPNSGNGSAADFANNWGCKSFQVWNPSDVTLVSQLRGNAMKIYGKNCLISFDALEYYPDLSTAPEAKTDDWLISPRVVGGTKLKFAAKQVAGNVNEKFQILVSYGTAKIEDFGVIAEDSLKSTAITKFEYDLPVDAHYFAIRNVTKNGFAFMIDNIDYTPGFSDLELTGYNIYKDGVKLNDEVVTSANYDLTEVSGGEYGVTAVYDFDGESAMATLNNTDGIGSIAADGATVEANGSAITVGNAANKPVMVFDVDGKLLYSTIGTDREMSLPVDKGIYVVKIGDNTLKVVNK